MSLNVRERPPLACSLRVATPGGPVYRLGADDPRAANKPQGLTFSTAMPGGFNQCSFSLERDPRLAYPDLAELSDLTIYGLGGSTIAWQGRIEDLPSTYDPAAAGFSPQAVGYQAHLTDDDSASMVYVDLSLNAWQGPSVARQLAIVTANQQLASASVGIDPSDISPALIQTITDSWASPYIPLAESWYDAGAGNKIAKIWYDVAAPSTDLSWHLQAGLSSDDKLTTTEGTADLNGGSTQSGYFSPATAYRYAWLQFYYGTTPAGTQGASYLADWKNLAVYGDHGLTLRGLSDPKGLYASDIIAHAIGAWCPLLSYSTGSGGSIQTSSFVIPHAVFSTPTTAAQIVKAVSQYELLDWAVWEGPTFYSNPRGQYSGARHWRARVGPAQLQATGPQSSRIYNGVVVMFTDASSGLANVVGPAQSSSLVDTDPENPANKVPNLRRYAPLQVSGQTTQAGAIQIGEQFLAAQKLLDTSGQATITGHVQDDRGTWWPAWMIRAGDDVTFLDAADNSARRVVSTSYSDSARANTIQLDQPPDSMTALLDRLGVVLSALQLG